MSILACQLKVGSWSLSEQFEIESEDALIDNRELTFFGRVDDSNDGIIDGYTFQFVCLSKQNENKPNEVKVYDDHVFIRMSWQSEDFSKLEQQAITSGIKLSFSLLIECDQHYSLAIKDSSKCKLASLTKTIIYQYDNSD